MDSSEISSAASVDIAVAAITHDEIVRKIAGRSILFGVETVDGKEVIVSAEWVE